MGSLTTAGILKLAKLAVGTDMMVSLVWLGAEGMGNKEREREEEEGLFVRALCTFKARQVM
jgi:hypothetical protein